MSWPDSLPNFHLGSLVWLEAFPRVCVLRKPKQKLPGLISPAAGSVWHLPHSLGQNQVSGPAQTQGERGSYIRVGLGFYKIWKQGIFKEDLPLSPIKWRRWPTSLKILVVFTAHNALYLYFLASITSISRRPISPKYHCHSFSTEQYDLPYRCSYSDLPTRL